MAQSIHDYVVESLKNCDIDDTAAETDIPKSTLLKIRIRWIENPGIRSIEKLYRHFKKREGRSLRRRHG